MGTILEGMNLSVLNIQQRISAVAILVVFFSAFLPWASVWNHNILGVQGDGIITLILAVIGAGVFLLGNDFLFPVMMPRKIADITLVVLSGLTALIGLIATVNIGGFASIGVYFTLFAAIAWTVGAVWHLVAMLNATNAQAVPHNAAPQNFGAPTASSDAQPPSTPAATEQPSVPAQDSAQPTRPQQETSAENSETPEEGTPQQSGQQDNPVQNGGPHRPGGYRPPQQPGQNPEQP